MLRDTITPTLTLRRIATRATPRVLFPIALVLLLADLTITAALHGLVPEANPVARTTYQALGWSGAGILAVGVITIAFVAADHRQTPDRIGRLAAGIVTGVMVVPVVWNTAVFAQLGSPTIWWSAVVEAIVPVAIVAVGMFAVREWRLWLPIAQKMAIGTPQQRRAVAMAVLMITAVPAGVAFVGTQSAADSQGGIAYAEEDGTTIFIGQNIGVHEYNDQGNNLDSYDATGGDYNQIVQDPYDDTVIYVGERQSDPGVWEQDRGSNSKTWNTRPGGSEWIRGLEYDTFDELLWVGDDTGSLYKMDPENGDVLASYDLWASSNVYDIMVSEEYVLTRVDGTIYKIDKGTGNIQDTYDVHDGADSQTLVADISGNVYSGSSDGAIKQFDPNTGDVIESINPPRNTIDDLIVDSESDVISYTSEGTVATYDLTDETELWSVSSSYNQVEWMKDGVVAKTSSSVHGIKEGSVDWTYSTDYSVRTITTTDERSSGIAADTAKDIPVKTVDQDGNPIENATVEGHGVTDTPFDGQDVDDLQSEAEDLESELSDPLPDEFDRDLDLITDFYEQSNNVYPAVNSESDWEGRNVPFLSDGAIIASDVDLRQPEPWVPSDEQVIVSCWDPTADTTFTGRPIDGELPGATTSCEVEFTQLSPTGESLSSTTVESQHMVTTTGPVGAIQQKDHEAVVTNLPDGVYRVSPVDSPAATVVTVGNPDDLASQFEAELEDQQDQLTERADRIQSLINDNGIHRTTNVTDADGTATLDSGNALTLRITAHKGPGLDAFEGVEDLEDINDPSEITMNDIRAVHGETYNGSIYVPRDTERIDPDEFGENETVELEMIKIDVPPAADIQDYQDLLDWLDEQFERFSPSELEEIFGDLEDADIGELQERYTEIREQAEENPFFYQELVDRLEDEADENDDVQNVIDNGDLPEDEEDIDQLSEEEIIQIIEKHSELLHEQPPSGDTETAVEAGQDAVDFLTRLTGAFDPEGIQVIAHYSDGTTETVDDEYVTVDQSGIADTQTEVHVEDFPLGEEDPAEVTFEVTAMNEDSVERARDSVANPTFRGSIPDIEAVDLSTLRPGPDESMSATLRPADRTTFGGVTAATVYGPGGDELEATVDGDTVRWSTAGQGAHTLRAQYTDETGETFVQRIRVDAGEASVSDPPTVQLRDNGDTVLAGEGLESARFERGDGVDDDRLTVTLPGDAGAPSKLHVQADTVSSDDLELRVVRGSQEEAVQSHVSVAIHTRLGDLEEDEALVYRGTTSQPITPDGETQYGHIDTVDYEDTSDTKHIIRTYTRADGTLDLSISRDPGIVERTFYSLRLSVPFGLSTLTSASPIGMAPTSLLVAGGEYIQPLVDTADEATPTGLDAPHDRQGVTGATTTVSATTVTITE